MYALLIVVTLLANQPQGAPAKYIETVGIFGTNSKQDCERLIAFSVSDVVRRYAEKGRYVSAVPTCVGTP